MRFIFIYIGILLILAHGYLFAQENVNQEVKVIKPYEPVINDAFKISELPKIVDTNKVITKFNYEIVTAQHSTHFTPVPIKPAKLISEPLSKLYLGHVKAGFGSYLSPLAEIYLGSKRSEQWNWSVVAGHNSSNGKIRNEVNERVYAGISNTQGSGEVNYFTKDSKVISFKAEAANKINYYYGYNPLVVNETTNRAPLVKDSIENQIVNFMKLNGELRTDYLDSTKVNYKVNVGYQNLSAKNGIAENALKIKTDLDYFFETEFIGADLFMNYYGKSGLMDSVNGAIVKFSPWVGAFGNKWRVVAGVSTFFDQASEKYYFYPRLSMHYNIIDYFLIPYFELNGNYQENSYKEIYDRNPFIRQNLAVTPTNNKLNITFGFRGNISSKIAFNTKINYSDIRNQYFFVNDTSEAVPLQNKFDVVYDDITRIRLLGEVSYRTGENLFLSLKANYYSYKMKNELHPWHMPNYTVSLNERYFIQKKIALKANIYALGERWVREFDENGIAYDKTLPGLVDLNLGVEYRLSKIFSAFADFNNLSSVKYYEWDHYSSQRFNVMLGLTYSF